MARRDPAHRGLYWSCAGTLFVATQLCLGQVSRVGPDELVSAFFFLACGLLLRLISGRRSSACGLRFGLVPGLGFLAKAIFLPLGVGLLLVLGMVEWLQSRRVRAVLGAVLAFGAMVLGGVAWRSPTPSAGPRWAHPAR